VYTDTAIVDQTAIPKMIFSHTTTGATHGGQGTAGSFQTRPITDEDFNNITGSSVDTTNNQFTLPQGTYNIRGFSYFHRTERTQTRLYNTTASEVTLYGGAIFVNDPAATNCGTISSMEGVFTVS